MSEKRADRPFDEEMTRLLGERQMSQRTLAAKVGTNPSHLSRLLRSADYRTRPSIDLVRRIALALGLPEDYFVEYREGVIIERVKSDASFREETYVRLTQRRPT